MLKPREDMTQRAGQIMPLGGGNVAEIRLVLFRDDPDFERDFSGKRHKSRKTAVLVHNSSPVGNFMSQNIAVHTSAMFVEITFCKFFPPSDMARDHACGDNLLVGVNKGGACPVSVVSKNDYHHVFVLFHQTQVTMVVGPYDLSDLVHGHHSGLQVMAGGAITTS